MRPIAVVGAGITGLAAAHELVRAGRETVLLDCESRAGGVILTERIEHAAGGGWIAEGGADSYMAADGDIPALARELGIADRIVGQTVHGSLLWDGTTLGPLTEGDAAALLGIQVRKEDLAKGHASFAGGMGELVAALARAAGPALRLGVGVNAVTSGDGLRLVTSAGKPIDVEALILALPAYRAARVLAALTRSVADLLAGVRYAPSRTVNLAYHTEQLRRPLEGTGFVVAPTAAIPLRACTYASRKFPHRAPDDHVLLRAFLEAAADDAPQRAHELLTAILDIRGSPLWHRCVEWPRGLPAYAPDHADRLAGARAALARLGPVFLAGAGYDGVGVSACVRSGRAAARDALSGRAAPAAASPPPPR